MQTYYVECQDCKTEYHFKATDNQIKKLQQGVRIQDALPHVSANIREIVISGICGKCFDKLFQSFEGEDE